MARHQEAVVGRRSQMAAVTALAVTSFLLTGYLGGVDCTANRNRAVPTRGAVIEISGWVDDPSSSVCAHQYRSDNVAVSLGCVMPAGSPDTTDTCGASWYPYYINTTLLSDSKFWAGRHDPAHDSYEYTKVLVTKAGMQNASLYTATDDFNDGPANGSSCYRSLTRENASLRAPLVYYREAVPQALQCYTPGAKPYAGCPFTCSLAVGCDRQYGDKLEKFYQPSHRINSEGQSVATTRFEHRGATSAAGTPSGDWSFQYNSGACVGGVYPGKGCDTESECDVWYDNTGICSGEATYVVMRRNSFTSDSLKLRRGAYRRNSKIDSWVKMKAVDVNNREIGLVQRWKDADNYFAFIVREYGGDYAKIHRYYNGTYATLAAVAPAVNLINWNKLGFDMRDNGSYVDDQWVPNGNCRARAYLNDTLIINLASTYCGFAPYGWYGPFSYYNSSAQFWDLNAYAK